MVDVDLLPADFPVQYRHKLHQSSSAVLLHCALKDTVMSKVLYKYTAYFCPDDHSKLLTPVKSKNCNSWNEKAKNVITLIIIVNVMLHRNFENHCYIYIVHNLLQMSTSPKLFYPLRSHHGASCSETVADLRPTPRHRWTLPPPKHT